MEYHKLDELRQALGYEPDDHEKMLWEVLYAHPNNEVLSNGDSKQEKLRRKRTLDIIISQRKNN